MRATVGEAHPAPRSGSRGMMALEDGSLSLFALPGIPEVGPGDDLCALIADALDAAGLTIESGDVVVVAQKIVSKAEGRLVRLDEITPSARARALAKSAGKDPRLIEVILGETEEVLRHRPGLVITVNRHGMVSANAGVDTSNVADESQGEVVLLLPNDPDQACRTIRGGLRARLGVEVGVIVSDTAGRAWRRGIMGFAIGVAGMPALRDLRGSTDRFGRPLQVTEVALADEIAAAASLLQGHGAEGRPVVVVRGLDIAGAPGSAKDLLRPAEQDLFR